MAKAVSLDMLKRFANRIGATFVKKRTGYDLIANTDKSKLDGIAAGANKYVHPAHTAHTSGLYKITVDGEGHITAVVAATKADITALGIPGQDTNTTYSNFKGATTAADGGAGLVPGPAKGAANRYLRSDGSWQVPPDTNTVYTLPSRLGTVCQTITDWNNVTENGFYMASGGSNAPTTGTWYFGVVIAHNTNYVRQDLYAFTANTAANLVPHYAREKVNGTWGAWINVTIGKAVPSNAVFTDTNTWRGIQDNLTSTSTTDSLSAAQGKVLNDRLKVVEDLLTEIQDGLKSVLVDMT